MEGSQVKGKNWLPLLGSEVTVSPPVYCQKGNSVFTSDALQDPSTNEESWLRLFTLTVTPEQKGWRVGDGTALVLEASILSVELWNYIDIILFTIVLVFLLLDLKILIRRFVNSHPGNRYLKNSRFSLFGDEQLRWQLVQKSYTSIDYVTSFS